MLLTVNALAGDVALSDPNPIDLGLVIALKPGNSANYSITTGELERLTPLLSNLESRTIAGAPIMTWSVSDDTAQDSRALLVGRANLNFLSAASVAVAGVSSVAVNGTTLMAGQAKAAATIGLVPYTAIVPGSTGNQITITHVVAGTGTSLSVSVSGNDITVNLATDGGGLATSTATLIAAAVAAHATAKFMVIATGSATVAKAATKTNLLAGAGAGIVVAVAGLACQIIDVSDTVAHIKIPALTGVTATWPVTLKWTAGLESSKMTLLTA